MCKSCCADMTRVSENNKILCKQCEAWFHIKCVNMKKNELEAIISSKYKWKCDSCVKKKSSLIDSAAGGADKTEKLDTIEKLLLDLVSQVRELKDQFKEQQKSLEYTHDKLDDQGKLINTTNEELKKIKVEVEQLKTENVNLRAVNENLQSRVNHLEIYSRRNCVEIHGIPQLSKNENLLSIIQDVGRALHFPITDTMLDAYHRMKSTQNQKNAAPGIIIKFCRRVDVEEFFRRKKIKRTLTTRDLNIGLQGEANPVYINESLSPSQRQLFYHCRQFKLKNSTKYLWTKNGIIYMRGNENSQVVQINSEKDLKLICKS